MAQKEKAYLFRIPESYKPAMFTLCISSLNTDHNEKYALNGQCLIVNLNTVRVISNCGTHALSENSTGYDVIL